MIFRTFHRRALACGVAVTSLLRPSALRAQERRDASLPVTRAEAIAAAVARSPAMALATADSAAAAAQLLTARTLPNPDLSLGYSKSAPRYHVGVDVPLDLPWARRDRVAAADRVRRAAQYRVAYARASAALAADTTYTLALAAAARSRLSARNAADADTLLAMARARRDAGDAAELDVQLAEVYAGQQLNLAAADSLALLSALLDLQATMGMPGEAVAVEPVDSLGALPADFVVTSLPPGGGAVPLRVAAASNALAAADLGVRAQRRARYGMPSLSAGFETHDPAGDERGILPTVGVTIPLPLLSRNQGAIAAARADRDRADAELALVRIESATEIGRVQRERFVAIQKVRRDQALLASAERVAAMALTAYREGAAALPNALEARRNAREVMTQTIDDLARSWIANAVLRVITLTTTPDAPPSR